MRGICKRLKNAPFFLCVLSPPKLSPTPNLRPATLWPKKTRKISSFDRQRMEGLNGPKDSAEAGWGPRRWAVYPALGFCWGLLLLPSPPPTTPPFSGSQPLFLLVRGITNAETHPSPTSPFSVPYPCIFTPGRHPCHPISFRGWREQSTAPVLTRLDTTALLICLERDGWWKSMAEFGWRVGEGIHAG